MTTGAASVPFLTGNSTGWDEGLVGYASLLTSHTLLNGPLQHVPWGKAHTHNPGGQSIRSVRWPVSRPPQLFMFLSGSRGFGALIPAGSALVFEVEMVSINGKKQAHTEL